MIHDHVILWLYPVRLTFELARVLTANAPMKTRNNQVQSNPHSRTFFTTERSRSPVTSVRNLDVSLESRLPAGKNSGYPRSNNENNHVSSFYKDRSKEHFKGRGYIGE